VDRAAEIATRDALQIFGAAQSGVDARIGPVIDGSLALGQTDLLRESDRQMMVSATDVSEALPVARWPRRQATCNLDRRTAGSARRVESNILAPWGRAA